jgi:hypothetical protein
MAGNGAAILIDRELGRPLVAAPPSGGGNGRLEPRGRRLGAVQSIRLTASLALCFSAYGVATAQETAREQAMVDLTGDWVSVVTEDWRWRMVTPPKGDYASVPLNDAGRRVADEWDPVADEGTCRPYGAPNLLRMPVRAQIEWEDDDTLRIETDHGMQTRLLHFEVLPSPVGMTRQGQSHAQWTGTSLKVVTTNLLPGYLRRNGVPYSAAAVVTEYFDRHSAYGDEWLTVTTIVEDPTYLTQEFITTSSFKRLRDGRTWNATACEER